MEENQGAGEKEIKRSQVANGSPFLDVVLVTLVLGLLSALAYVYWKPANFLKVEQVLVQGARRLSTEEVVKAARVKPGDVFFAVKPKRLERWLKRDPWIKEATVRTIPPGKVIITVKEREAVALLKAEKLFYLDPEGNPFKEVIRGDEVDYPVITGLDASYPKGKDGRNKKILGEALRFLQVVKEFQFPPLGNISELNVTEAYGLILFTLNEGLEIRMGSPPYRDKLWRLNEVIKMQPGAVSRARYVDVSFPGQVVLGQ